MEKPVLPYPFIRRNESKNNRDKRAYFTLRQLLLEHPVYQQLRHLDDLNILMEQHVFAVWDFMALLKSLQFGVDQHQCPLGCLLETLKLDD